MIEFRTKSRARIMGRMEDFYLLASPVSYPPYRQWRVVNKFTDLGIEVEEGEWEMVRAAMEAREEIQIKQESPLYHLVMGDQKEKEEAKEEEK